MTLELCGAESGDGCRNRLCTLLSAPRRDHDFFESATGLHLSLFGESEPVEREWRDARCQDERNPSSVGHANPLHVGGCFCKQRVA